MSVANENIREGISRMVNSWDKGPDLTSIDDIADQILALFKTTQSKAYDELLDKLPNYRKDTRGATQNPDNVTYHTKTAKGFNECLDQVIAIINLAKERLS